MHWTGVALDTVLAVARRLPSASHVVAYSHTGYTTNLPLEDVTGGKAWVAFEVDGQPLARDHGGPVRLLVPHLYFWKSAKWIAGLRILDHDEPGVGDTLEARGPIGGWFVWDGSTPALLIGGGSGVVPVMAMLRHARSIGATAHLIVSARTPEDVIYADALTADDATLLYTRNAAPGSSRPPGRITADDIAPHINNIVTAFISGSAGVTDTSTERPLEACQ